jgi:hypothetical protein
MATKLFLRNTTNNGITDTADDVVYDMVATAGSASDTDVVGTVASGTENQWRQAAGGNTVAWISGRVPSGGFTLTSADISAWLHESNMNANCGGRLRVFKRAANGTVTELGGGPFNDGVEFAVGTPTEMTWVANVTDTAFAEDDRILIRLYITNVGSMGGGFDCTLTFNAADGSTGDSFFNIAETVTFKVESTTFPQSVSGAFSNTQLTGALAKQASFLRTLTAAVSFVGALVKHTSKNLPASVLSAAGLIVSKVTQKVLQGVIGQDPATSGSIGQGAVGVMQVGSSGSGAPLSGSLAKSFVFGKLLSGAVSFVGVSLKAWARTLSSRIGKSGSEYFDAVSASSPAAYWRMNESAGATQIVDAVAGKTGAIAGVNGVEQKGLSFDGSDYVQISDHADLDVGTGDYTIEIWFKSTVGPGGNDGYLFRKRPGGGSGYQAYYNGGGAQINWQTSGGVGSIAGTINDGQWHHFALVRSGGTVTPYLDGNAGTSVASAANDDNGDPLYLGSQFGTGDFFVGQLDEFSITKSALSQATLRSHVAAGRGGMSASLVKQTVKTVVGVVTSSSVLGRLLGRMLASAITSAGALAAQKLANKILSGFLGLSGALSHNGRVRYTDVVLEARRINGRRDGSGLGWLLFRYLFAGLLVVARHNGSGDRFRRRGFRRHRLGGPQAQRFLHDRSVGQARCRHEPLSVDRRHEHR